MKVKNPKHVADLISHWLREHMEKRGVGKFATAVIGLSGGIDSALVALLCKYAKLDVLCVNMPCCSSRWSMERAMALAKDFDLRIIEVDATALAKMIEWNILNLLNQKSLNREHSASLYSCIRTPILDYVSKCVGGRIVGTGNRDEDFIVRYFSKRGDGAVDLSPIADLHKSEVRQMFEWLATTLSHGVMPESARTILSAKPSADLWGGAPQYDEDELGFTYDQVEWVDRFVAKNSTEDFWFSDGFHRNWLIDQWVVGGKCSREEADLILKISAIELATKHKANPNIPVCKLHDGTVGLFED